MAISRSERLTALGGGEDLNDIGNIATAVKQEDAEALNLKKVAEALNATDLLGKMSWLHACPNTWQHWDGFVAIMDFCRERIRDQAIWKSIRGEPEYKDHASRMVE